LQLYNLTKCEGCQTSNGATGPAGTNGTNGTNGVDGTNGTNGTNGVDGTNGTNGVDGTNGTNGADGATGPQGIQGLTGPQGPNGAMGGPIVTKTSAYTLTTSDFTILADATASPFTVTLPPSPIQGEMVNIKKIDSTANIVTVSGNGATIDGTATIAIPYQWVSVTLQYDAVSLTWSII
jgi:hypothetical protein